MPIFHWCLVGFCALMLGLLAASRRRERAQSDDADEETRQECSLCGREDGAEAFVERQFMSGYHHHLCGSCVAELHGEATSRDLVPQDVEEVTE
jgi:hypothetical protein